MEENKYLWKVYFGQTAKSHGSDIDFKYHGYDCKITKYEAWEVAKKLVGERVKMKIEDLYWFWIQPSFSGNNLSIRECDALKYGWYKNDKNTYGGYTKCLEI